MATVFLTVNGIGHGHLTRALRISHWLRRTGRHPVIFHQGKYPAEAALRFPGTTIPTLYELPDREAQRIADAITQVARLSRPALIVEDTHPAEVRFPRDITRILIVRPTVPEHMRMLHDQYSREFSRVIICDHPDSPTWPYSQAETEEFLSWKGWHVVGPVFRRHSTAGIARVRERHGIRDGDEVIVFSLGGGGEKPGTQDRTRFIEQATQIAERLRASSSSLRLLFVCGPLFPAGLLIPPVFEAIKEEPEMPSLFALAKAAVIRAGYNSIWECIAAQTPFVPLSGTTYMEPSLQRLERLRRAGFNIPDEFPDDVGDSEWRDSFRLASQKILRRFSGSPQEDLVKIIQSVSDFQPERTFPCRPPQRKIRSVSTKTISAEKRFLTIRIACVAEICPALKWIAALCQSRSLYASLEVIPYLSTLKSSELDEIDSEQRLEISQHGYSHVPTLDRNNRIAGEFGDNPGSSGAVQLKRGFRLLRYRFRRRFKGGYSPPYECLPSWLPKCWDGIGGKYISVIEPCKAQCELPMFVSCIRPDRKWTFTDLTSRIIQCWQDRGMVNIALDMRDLGSSRYRAMLERALDFSLAHGGQAARISDLI